MFLPVLFSALGIVCAGTCFYHVKLKEPLTALKQGISHIADNDLDFSIGYGKQDELGELCRAFETMRGELVKNNRYMCYDVFHNPEYCGSGHFHNLLWQPGP